MPAPCSPLPRTRQKHGWRPIADLAGARAWGAGVSLGSTVFAVGGLQSDMQVGAGGGGGGGGVRAPGGTAALTLPAAPHHCPSVPSTLPTPCPAQTHALLCERYDAAADKWVHVSLPPNANPRRSFLAACGME